MNKRNVHVNENIFQIFHLSKVVLLSVVLCTSLMCLARLNFLANPLLQISHLNGLSAIVGRGRAPVLIRVLIGDLLGVTGIGWDGAALCLIGDGIGSELQVAKGRTGKTFRFSGIVGRRRIGVDE